MLSMFTRIAIIAKRKKKKMANSNLLGKELKKLMDIDL
jgi:hypothetical protein